MADDGFVGFTRELTRFLGDLERNNDKAWFDQNRTRYEEVMLGPAKDFVAAMQPLLATIEPTLRAEPRVGGSILRVARDTRFSKDKAPYKAHLDMMFWQGAGRNKEAPCFFMRISARNLTLGAGLHGFTPGQRARYRAAVADEAQGAALGDVIRTVTARGFALNGPHYKRVPRGFAADHPRAALLRHNALFAARSDPLPDALFGSRAPEYCRQMFVALRPLQAWLVATLS